VYYQLVTAGLVEVLNANGEVVFDELVAVDGQICIPIHPDDDYRIYRLRTRRRSEIRPAMQVHFKGGDRPRLLGIIREEP
jgi:hypothetical protein